MLVRTTAIIASFALLSSFLVAADGAAGSLARAGDSGPQVEKRSLDTRSFNSLHHDEDRSKRNEHSFLLSARQFSGRLGDGVGGGRLGRGGAKGTGGRLGTFGGAGAGGGGRGAGIRQKIQDRVAAAKAALAKAQQAEKDAAAAADGSAASVDPAVAENTAAADANASASETASAAAATATEAPGAEQGGTIGTGQAQNAAAGREADPAVPNNGTANTAGDTAAVNKEAEPAVAFGKDQRRSRQLVRRSACAGHA